MKDTFEPYVLKGTRTDLGRERESNLSDLSDRRKNNYVARMGVVVRINHKK